MKNTHTHMIHYLRPLLILLFSICAAFSESEFKPVTEWKAVFPGIWSTNIGDASAEQSWTALAAEPPRKGALEALSEINFPFLDTPIEFIKTDGRIGISIPTTKESKIYGLGLQLDGIDKTQGAFELKADHWGGGGG